MLAPEGRLVKRVRYAVLFALWRLKVVRNPSTRYTPKLSASPIGCRMPFSRDFVLSLAPGFEVNVLQMPDLERSGQGLGHSFSPAIGTAAHSAPRNRWRREWTGGPDQRAKTMARPSFRTHQMPAARAPKPTR